MKAHPFLIVIALLVVACGDATDNHPEEKAESTEVDAIEPPIPEYEITSSGVECKNRADITETTTPDDCTTTRCAWLCADYKNQKPVNVSITFRGCGGELPEVFSEDVQSAKPVVCEAILANP